MRLTRKECHSERESRIDRVMTAALMVKWEHEMVQFSI